DLDVWLRLFWNEGGFEFYEYVFIYMDDFLCISYDLKSILDIIGKYFKFKLEFIKILDIYLGVNFGYFLFFDKLDKL
ncbi:hypothetical protein, partial [Proteus mirabilis]|uniref:hypothetical protein n=1 Tax=Proteus mirabilis TaxID=584 RepID=UPI0025783D78